ncbi:MAG: UDP-3-O-acyl-N-acetylglucosamine deacetylase [Candidatus Binatia bacterium]|nr:UDP-3-O-acyl-N-acetylglucosamine deacetylase [Candidatus Binatia bacterium]
MATVLVVDDEPEIRATLRGILVEEGLNVVEAEDGKSALTAIRKTAPDLVIVDVWMPEMDGLEFLRALNAAPDVPHRPAVVMISGHGNIETAVKATKLGAVDFVEKPFSLDGFLSTIERALQHQREHRDAGSPRALGSGQIPDAVAANRAWRQGQQTAQRTVARSVVHTGTGLHSGAKTGLILQPLPAGSGIVFSNLSAEATVPAHLDYVDSTGYATTLHRHGVTIRTVEHLLAALHAYRVTNLLVKVQGEVPILDGSAIGFCHLLESAGTLEQDEPAEEIVIDDTIEVRREANEWIRIEPFDGFAISYLLEYPPPVGQQLYHYVYHGPASFRDEIAPARTFGFVRDLAQMAAMGLASGGRLDNCILIDDEKVVNTTLRFPDELARHKILDIMGDMYLLGRPLRGKITARRTGHSENIALLREIQRRYLASGAQ